MNKLYTTLLTLAALSLALPPGIADHCETWTTSNPEVDLTGQGLPYYADNDLIFPEGVSFWVYEESNGITGLQRGDEVHDDTCHGLIASDTIIV